MQIGCMYAKSAFAYTNTLKTHKIVYLPTPSTELSTFRAAQFGQKPTYPPHNHLCICVGAGLYTRAVCGLYPFIRLHSYRMKTENECINRFPSGIFCAMSVLRGCICASRAAAAPSSAHSPPARRWRSPAPAPKAKRRSRPVRTALRDPPPTPPRRSHRQAPDP